MLLCLVFVSKAVVSCPPALLSTVIEPHNNNNKKKNTKKNTTWFMDLLTTEWLPAIVWPFVCMLVALENCISFDEGGRNE